MENKKKKRFELLYEQNGKLNLNQMKALKGGQETAPPGCGEQTIGWSIGIFWCTILTIGSAQ